MKRPTKWQRFLIVSAIAFAASGTALAGAISWLGLDNDSLYNTADAILETVQPSEEIGFRSVANLIASFVKTQKQLRETAARDSKSSKEERRISGDLPAEDYATRDVHRKTNGCFKASLDVSKGLLRDFNQTLDRSLSRIGRLSATAGWPGIALANNDDLGVFQPGAHFDAIVRFSNGHPLNRPDGIPDARGFAVKILRGSSLANGSDVSTFSAEDLNRQTVLDILSINFPTFFVNQNDTAEKYLNINEQFLKGAYDFRNGFLKTKFTEALATFGSGLTTMELRLALLVNGSVIDSDLAQEYFSMVPSRLGAPGTPRAVKYIWVPAACSAEDRSRFERSQKSHTPLWAKSHDYADPLASLVISNPTHPMGYSPRYSKDYLRRDLAKSLSSADACFALYLQPYLDQDSTNIEDSTDIWLRSESERNWWLKSVVPGALSPYWLLGHQNRGEYVRKIKRKAVSEPVFAGLLRINRLSTAEFEAKNSKTCEDLSFNPWNGDIYHHKPLGVISRLKRRVYNASRRMRHGLNHVKDDERQEDTK